MRTRPLRSLIAILVLAVATGPTALAAPAPPPSPAEVTVTDLTVEHATNPLGIDAERPRLSWVLTSRRRGVRQGAYQVQVASSAAALAAGRADVWDSGRVASSSSVGVRYGGPALRSRTRYFWRVRVWDGEGRASAWSGTAWWEMGLLQRSDWQAGWIGAPGGDSRLTLTGASWIWYPEGDPAQSAPAATRYFRRTLDLPSDRRVAKARFLLTADDQYVLYAGGTEVARSSGQPDAWRQAAVVDLTEHLEDGASTLALAVTNSGGPAAWIGKLQVTYADGSQEEVVTDAAWRAATDGPPGWEQPGFDDAGWAAALEVAPYGAGPWGTQVQLPQLPPPLLRKDFTLAGDARVRRARLYASALGLYEVRLNGRRVGDQLLTPGWTDYRQRVQYQTYDVTELVRQGPNAIGALLGEGWFAGRLQGGQRYGDTPLFLAQLEVEYADGTVERVVTDGSWTGTTDGPIRSSGIYDGEVYDARREPPGWDRPGFGDPAWRPVAVDSGVDVALSAQAGPPIRVERTLRPVRMTEPRPGTYVFDMGQNMVGWVRLRVTGERGTEVTLRHAEVLNPDGTIYTANLRSARQADTYVLKGGGEEAFQPHFTYHGFRYVEVTGYPGRPALDAVTGVVFHADTPFTGSFTTSNPMLNRLQQSIVWGLRGNFMSVPTDCPQRDERLGWTGDAQMIAGTAAFNLDVAGFFTKWVRDLEEAQEPSGAFPDVAPRVCCGAGTAGWGDAGVIVPWVLWQRYGDTRVIERHYGAMQRWIEYLRAHSDGYLRPDQGYGDWLNVNDDTPRDVIGTAFFAYSAKLLAEMAAAIGRDADAATYRALFEDVRQAFTSAYVTGDGRVKGDTQTAYVLALHMDLLPADLRARAAARLVELIRARGWHLSTGFLGTPHLLQVLTDAGYEDVAYRLLTQDTFPSWGYMIERGATTIWERWDSIRPDGSFNDPGMNSFNHYGFGAVGDWMYRNVGGIAPGAPGYERIIVRPLPGGGLTWAKAKYQSVRGEIEVEWEAEDGAFKLEVTVPANATATVYVPTSDPASVTEGGTDARRAEGVRFLRSEGGYAVYEVGSGTYSFASEREGAGWR